MSEHTSVVLIIPMSPNTQEKYFQNNNAKHNISNYIPTDHSFEKKVLPEEQPSPMYFQLKIAQLDANLFSLKLTRELQQPKVWSLQECDGSAERTKVPLVN